MATYFMRFGAGDPRTLTGLAPTFLSFKKADGTNVTPPSITEVSATGIYQFAYSATLPLTFLADAATISPGVQGRFVTDSIGPSDNVDQLIGTTSSSYGSTSVDPGDLFGYVKRIQELLEGNGTFNKTSESWSLYSRGSSTLLRTKTITSDVSGVTKL